jgi:hypothetical protein
MASEVQICNIALSKVGDEQITSLLDDSKAARLCNLTYEPLRDSVLRAHLWNFAISRVALAKSTDAPAYEYSAKFALPADFLRLVDTNLLDTEKYKVEGKFILANSDTVSIRYVKRVEDPNEFDWLFIEALAARIAAELAIALTDNRTLSVDLFNLYSTKITEARTADAQEGSPDDIIADSWLQSRLLYVNPVD